MATLEAAVNTDSGTPDPAGVNAVADLVQARLAGARWTVERRRPDPLAHFGQLGDIVIGGRPRAAGGRRILLMAHMDTVFEAGTAAAWPLRTEGDRAFGPGVCDDKAGLVAGIEAVELLVDDAAFDDFAELVLVCNPDEEVGSPVSRPVI